MKPYLLALVLAAWGAGALAAPPNPFARPSTVAPVSPAPMPGSPGGTPTGAPPYQPGAAMPAPGFVPGMPGIGAEQPEDTRPFVEEIRGTRVGKVNGMHIYRGDETYVFAPASTHKVQRRLLRPDESGALLTGTPLSPQSEAASTAHLPSAVGRPAPRK